MAEKMYLNLLFLCGIFSQEIIGNLAHENIVGPSNILDRQKRVINRIPGKDERVLISDARFIVHIKEDMRIKCAGAILSNHVVITIIACVQYTPSDYYVSASASSSDSGYLHAVTSIRKNFGNHTGRPTDGIALLTVAPSITFGRSANAIQLHSAPLLPGMVGTVYGWGFHFRSQDRGTEFPRNLRSIEVPILAHRDCVNTYRPRNIEISDKDICTYHRQKYCGHNDGGAPLVVDGFLAGLHLWTGQQGSQMNCEYPDVFVVLQHSTYKQWIISNVQNIEANS